MLDHDGMDLADVREAAAEAAWRGREIATADALKGNPPTKFSDRRGRRTMVTSLRSAGRGTKRRLMDPLWRGKLVVLAGRNSPSISRSPVHCARDVLNFSAKTCRGTHCFLEDSRFGIVRSSPYALHDGAVMPTHPGTDRGREESCFPSSWLTLAYLGAGRSPASAMLVTRGVPDKTENRTSSNFPPSLFSLH